MLQGPRAHPFLTGHPQTLTIETHRLRALPASAMRLHNSMAESRQTAVPRLRRDAGERKAYKAHEDAKRSCLKKDMSARPGWTCVMK